MRKIFSIQNISRTVILLSAVSLLNDVSSEMLIPVMPVYLQSIGFTMAWIGILEGMAEATAGLSKIYFGRLSDAMQVRMPFVRLGYLLSAFAKPVTGLFSNVTIIFSARTSDRLGKGIRTGARDAMLSDESTPETKGAVFGFHRSMDTMGAAIGPALALVFLIFNPGNYKLLFLLAFIPALVSVAFTFLVKEKKHLPKARTQIPFFKTFLFPANSNAAFKKWMTALLVFAFINSSDIFLLLKAKSVLKDDTLVMGMYILYNLVYALCAFPLGRLADKVGLKNMLVAGYLIFVLVYGGMAMTENKSIVIFLFAVYGIYNAATDGISKAIISNITPKHAVATALGFFSGWSSIGVLFASVAAGFLWNDFHSPQLTFLLSAGITFLVAVYLWVQPKIEVSKN